MPIATRRLTSLSSASSMQSREPPASTHYRGFSIRSTAIRTSLGGAHRCAAFLSTPSTRAVPGAAGSSAWRRGPPSVSSNQNVLPSPGLALQADPPAHQADEAPADRQPQPGAAVPAAGPALDLREALEDVGLAVLRDADAGVAHQRPGCVARSLSRTSEAAPPGRPRRAR